LRKAAHLTMWPTPATRDGKGGYLGGRIRNGELSTDTLDVAAQLTAAWTTPTADDTSSRRKPYEQGGSALSYQANLAGWATPCATEMDQTPEMVIARKARLKESTGIHRGPALPLGTMAQLTSWPTPTAANADGGQMPKDCSPTGLRANGSKATVSLQGIARLSTWPTPRAEDSECSGARVARGVNDTLTAVTRLAGWPTPLEDDANNGTRATGAYQSLTRATHGVISSGSPAGTENTGQLNPAFSRWLMGFPDAWDACAPTATPSSRKSQRNSSRHI
jgi:hypothetical protein